MNLYCHGKKHIINKIFQMTSYIITTQGTTTYLKGKQSESII